VTHTSPIRRGVVTGGDLDALQAWAVEVGTWPAGSHRWGQYAERTSTGEAVCRTENVSACHDGFAGLGRGALAGLAATALGVDVVDFKDKINYKRPGGAGFRPHQDLRAYPGATRVVSILVAIDECTTASGCLWLALEVDALLPTDGRGVVAPDVASALSWSPAELAPGDAVCIGGLTPHYSEANNSSAPRRVLVTSYAPAGDSYDRDSYYAARTREMERATARDDRFRISTLADFDGIEVEGDRAGAPKECWHR
jgi:hypothetical protein